MATMATDNGSSVRRSHNLARATKVYGVGS